MITFEALLEALEKSLAVVWHVSWQAAVLALLIVGVQTVIGKRISARWRYGLWWLLIVRLLMPVMPSTSWSVYNLAPKPSNVSAPRSEAPAASAAVPQAGPLSLTATPSPQQQTPFNSPQTQPQPHPKPEPQIRSHSHSQSKPLPPSPRWAWTWPQALGGLWLSVAILLLLRNLKAEWAQARQFRTLLGPKDERLTQLLHECAERLQLRSQVRLIETDRIDRPAVCGLLRPTLLLPVGFANRFTHSDLRHVFLHELAHVQRQDLRTQFAVNVLQAVHWFNPLLWWAFARMRADRELATDELALAAAGNESGVGYGETLLRVLQDLQPTRRNLRVVGIAEDKAQLKVRLQSIVEFGRIRHWRAVAPLCLLGIACVALTDARETSPAKPDAVAKPKAVGLKTFTLVVVDEASGERLDGGTLTTVMSYDDGRVGTFSGDLSPGSMQMSFDPTTLRSLEYRVRQVGYVETSGVWRHQEILRLPERLLLPVTRGVEIGGRVVDPKGKPIPNAVVYCDRTRRYLIGAEFGRIQSQVVSVAAGVPLATTDADGRWRARCASEKLRVVRLRIRHPDYADGIFSTDLTKEMQRMGVGTAVWFEDLRGLATPQVLEPGRRVWGVVRNERGEALSGVVVQYTDRGSEEHWGKDAMGLRDVTTDEQGQFRLPHLRSQKHHFVAQVEGYAPAVVVWDPANGTDRIELVLNQGRVLTGTVVDQTGQPVADAGIEMMDWNYWLGARWTTTSDSEGRFRWDHAPRDRFRVRLSKAGYLHRRPVVSTELEQTLTLPEPLTVTGRVVDSATGQPLDAFQIRWKSRSDAERWEPVALSGEKGRYRIDLGRLHADGWSDGYPHEFRFRVEAKGYRPQTSRVFHSRKDDLGELNRDWSLEPVDLLKGVVLGAEGRPVRGAEISWRTPSTRVYLMGAPAFENPYEEVLSYSGENGEFELNPDPEGFGVIAVHDDGIAWVSVSEWDAAKPMVLRLEPWARVEGTVRAYDQLVEGTEIHGTIQIFPGAGPVDLSRAIGQTDAGGRFQFDYLPPGRHRFDRMYRQEEGNASGGGVVVDLEPGQTAQVQLGGQGRRVVGRFELENPYVVVDWRGDTQHASARSVLPNPPKGVDTVEALQAWRRRPEIAEQFSRLKSHPVQFSPGGQFQIDEVLPGNYQLAFVILDPRDPDSFSHGYYLATVTHDFQISGAEVGLGTDAIDLGVIPVRLKPDLFKNTSELPAF